MKKSILTLVEAGGVAQLGVLDTSGINPATGVEWAPGDQYRLAFVTSNKTQATSADIATYNAFVQSAADAADAAGLGGATWKAIGSTLTVAARDNTGTNPGSGVGVPMYLTDGVTKIADNNADLWDGSIDSALSLDENGTNVTGDVWTGSNGDGTPRSTATLLSSSQSAILPTDHALWLLSNQHCIPGPTPS